MRSKKSFGWMIAILVGGLLLTPDPLPAQTKYINFGGSGPGGLWYHMVGGVSPILTREIKGLNVVAEATGGDLENARRMGKKELDMVFLHGATLMDVYHGKGNFKDRPPAQKIRILCKVYDSGFTAAVLKDSKIKGYSDLIGKKVAVGPPGSGTLKSAQMVFGALGLLDKVDMKFLGYDDGATALKEGHVDAVMQNGAPASNIMSIEATQPIRLIGLNPEEREMFRKKYPAIVVRDIPAGTYKTVQEPVPSFWSVVYWVTHSDLEEKWGYEILKTVFDPQKKRDLENIQVLYKQLSPGLEEAKDLGVPHHPGAIKFYKEKGLN